MLNCCYIVDVFVIVMETVTILMALAGRILFRFFLLGCRHVQEALLKLLNRVYVCCTRVEGVLDNEIIRVVEPRYPQRQRRAPERLQYV
jgi:hypothetical protein